MSVTDGKNDKRYLLPEYSASVMTVQLPAMKKRFSCLGWVALLSIGSARLLAATMISNLGTPFDGQGIGDIQAIFSAQHFGMSFQTGITPYQIDSITVEHFEYSASAASGLDLQILQIGSRQSGPFPDTWSVSLVGKLGNPVVDPRATQWPGWTTFVSYTPVTSFTLEPNTLYMVAAPWPSNDPGYASLLFAPGNYAMGDDWPETGRLISQWINSGNGWRQRPSNYDLKLELNATPAPEPCASALMLFGFAAVSRQFRKRGRCGKAAIQT